MTIVVHRGKRVKLFNPLNLVKIKSGINQQDLKFFAIHFVKLNNFHSLEVVDRVSETQLQLGENSN